MSESTPFYFCCLGDEQSTDDAVTVYRGPHREK